MSIGGLLNIPDIGQQFHYAGANDVTTAVGIAVVQSYRLVGEADVPSGWTRVTEVRNALERVESLAYEASLSTVEVGRLRKDLASGAPSVQRSHLDEELARRRCLESELRLAKDSLRELANTPGIVIARWAAEGRAGAGLSLDGVGGVDGDSSENRTGFVVLGGLRVVSVVFGEDFWWMLNNLRPHEKDYIDQIGVTTSLLQARDVAYTSSLRTEVAASLAAELRTQGDVQLESLRVAGYWSFVGQYSNSGNLPRVRWRREPFCAVCSVDIPGLACCADRSLQAYFDVAHEPVDPASFQGWRTVAATVTYLHDVLFFFGWEDHAEKYSKERKMWSSPSCAFCGVRREPAIVPGHRTHHDCASPRKHADERSD